MSDKPAIQKIKLLVITGISALILGYAMHWSGMTPIIKKIATSSFVVTSGGYVILALALSYWLMDVKKLFPRFSKAFIIVGMNCIFIYMFNALGGSAVLHKIFTPFTTSVLSWSGEFPAGVIQGLAVYFSLWYICYWMYKKGLFIKI
jgi:predicted acyltransferase